MFGEKDILNYLKIIQEELNKIDCEYLTEEQKKRLLNTLNEIHDNINRFIDYLLEKNTDGTDTLIKNKENWELILYTKVKVKMKIHEIRGLSRC